MKPIHSLFFAVCLSLFILSCKETPPYINMVPSHVATDTNYLSLPAPSPEQKNAVIEEFTGVRCPNCPAAQKEAAAIATNNPNRVHIITIHPFDKVNPLTTPFSSSDPHPSKYDFRTLAGAKIFELVGPTNSLPIGSVNRILFPGETSRNIDYQKWAAHVNSQLSIPTPLNIALKAKNTNDSITIDVTLKYTDFVADSAQYLTLVIIESGMIDPQESTNTGGQKIIVEDYEHKHVLRAIVTDYYGDLLKAKLEPGRVFFKRYTYKRDTSWVKTNLDIVAMVHLNTTKQNVIHSKEAHVE
ncbi:MAG: Omp28-related outer membrane protein [Bacteroidota bacterium]|nr:Omp28-related outer membrane protein [Bacteroidota bacterium]